MTKVKNKTSGHGKHYYRLLCNTIIMFVCLLFFFDLWHAFVRVNNQTGHLTGLGNLGMSLIIYTLLLMIIFYFFGAFKIGVNRKMDVIASQVASLFTVNICEILISMAITGEFRFFVDFLWRYILLSICQSVIVCVLTNIMIAAYQRLFPPLQMIEICGEHSNELYDKINSRSEKYHVCKSIGFTNDESKIIAEIQKYDAVLINDLPSHEKNIILKLCFRHNIRVYFLPKISDIIVKASENLNLFDTPLYLCKNHGMTLIQRFLKRFFDIFLSTVAIIILSPIFIITMLSIKLDDHGPVFFRQKRCTIGGNEFWILKFRSMIVDAEKDGKSHPAGANDDRITRVGRIIRATRVDELPQLINILKGEMSIVGPRPERIAHVEKYTNDIPEFRFRHKVKGGLTGYAQVYGKYNTTALDKLKFDMIYITNYSLLLDIKILFETVKAVFKKESTEGFTEERVIEMHDSDKNSD